jgi:diguanylate cyclase (GGDEF)-like protein
MLRYPMKSILQELALDIEFDGKLTYRRVLLITGVLLITALTLTFYALLSVLIFHDQITAFLDSTASIISIYAIYHLKKYKNVPLIAKISTFNLIILLISLIFVHGSDHFVLIWTITVPIYAILTNGKRIGVYFSILFYSILFTLAFNNIGVWNNGDWLVQDWLRLVFASVLVTFGMYINESAMEESDKKLVQVREKEKKYIQILKEKSITDELTGLFNRRYYNEMIPKLISLAKRKKHFITFFILDIDYFKNYNDHYGHIKGDATLVAISQVIKNHIQRGDDFVFRLGGEEFAGIILSDDKEKTHNWILSLTSLVEDLKIKHETSKISEYVTASIGVSTIPYDKDYGMDQLYHFADIALYKAKELGRNRSEFHEQCA